MRSAYKMVVGKTGREKNHSEDLGLSGRIILKEI
jgi:hypothetical protein